jgi:transcription elongation factor GreA
MTKPVKMSRGGIKKLQEELKQLKYEARPKIVAEIKRARELGDLSENAEYHAAKEAQSHLERKIADIEYKLARAEVVDVDDIPTDAVYIFASVLVKDHKFDEEVQYKLVPPDDADVDNDIISVESPIGKGLLGKKVGDVVEIAVPAGTLKYEILRISRD